MVKFVIYYRVSTQQQGESGLGLQAQKAYILHFIPPDNIAEELQEIASGKDIQNRPILQEAITLCQQKGYFLATAKIDRLSRNTEDALRIYRELDGRLYSCDIPTEMGSRMDKFTLTLYMAIADRERELISIRTKQALQAKKKRGEKLGNPQYLSVKGRSLGHTQNRLNARQAKENKQVTDLIMLYREQGMSFQTIANTLNEKEFRTRGNGKKGKGSCFYSTTVKRLYDRAINKMIENEEGSSS